MANGLLFGLVTGLFGGLFWALIVSVPPDEALIASRWIVIAGGFVFWFVVGFVVGVFNAPTIADEITSQGREGNSLIQRMLIAVGWFLYRLIVGCFVGVIATVILSLCLFTLWLVLVLLILHLHKDQLDNPVGDALKNSMATSIYCCINGGVFGALFGPRWSPVHRPALSSRAFRSSFLSFLIGLPFGASMGWLTPVDTRIFVSLAATVPIGILAGILGGLWTDIRNIQRRALKDDWILKDRLRQDATADESPSHPAQLNDADR